MDFSWLANLAPEVVPAVVIVAGLAILVTVLSNKAAPVLREFLKGMETTRKAYETVNKQQNDLIDRLEKMSQREIENIRKELDTEKIARADLERRFIAAQLELTKLRDELAEVRRDRADVAAERDRLAKRVQDLETEVANLQSRLNAANGITSKDGKDGNPAPDTEKA